MTPTHMLPIATDITPTHRLQINQQRSNEDKQAHLIGAVMTWPLSTGVCTGWPFDTWNLVACFLCLLIESLSETHYLKTSADYSTQQSKETNWQSVHNEALLCPNNLNIHWLIRLRDFESGKLSTTSNLEIIDDKCSGTSEQIGNGLLLSINSVSLSGRNGMNISILPVSICRLFQFSLFLFVVYLKSLKQWISLLHGNFIILLPFNNTILYMKLLSKYQ